MIAILTAICIVLALICLGLIAALGITIGALREVRAQREEIWQKYVDGIPYRCELERQLGIGRHRSG